jgi:Lon protease-like protein
MAVEIPLFPLRTVLFPGMPLPLRIFEERYKVMTRELLAAGSGFGVILIREGHEVGGGAIPHTAGTLAYIEEHREIEGGRFVLSARGARRFRLLKMLPPAPYPRGEIQFIDESYDPADRHVKAALETVRATFPAYFRLALSRTEQWARDMALPGNAHDLVNFVAPWLQVEEEVKQRLIDAESAGDRLSELASVLHELLGRTRDEVMEYRRLRYHGLGSRN